MAFEVLGRFVIKTQCFTKAAKMHNMTCSLWSNQRKKKDAGQSFHWSQHYKAEYVSEGLFLLISFMLCLMHCAINVCVSEMESCSWYFSLSFLECSEILSAVLFFSSVLLLFSHVVAKSRCLNESVLSGWTESVEAFIGNSNEFCKKKNTNPPDICYMHKNIIRKLVLCLNVFHSVKSQ